MENVQNTNDEIKSTELKQNNYNETENTKENTDIENKQVKPKKKNPVFKIIMIPILILLIIFCGILGFAVYSAVDGANPENYIPEGHYIYINIPSAGNLLKKTLELQTIDSVLTSPEFKEAKGLLKSLRVSPLLSKFWFNTASDFRIDAAAYENNDYVIFIKLGFRSAAVRLIPLVLKFNPDIFLDIKELNGKNEDGLKYWEYKTGENQYVYLTAYKDSVIASNSKKMLILSLQQKENINTKTTKRIISQNKNNILNILPNIDFIVKDVKENKSVIENIITKLNFPKNNILKLNIENEDVITKGSAEWETEDDGLKNILQKKSCIPGVLSRLPKSIDYITLINMGDTEFLFSNGKNILTENILKTYKTASNTSKFIFKKNIDELLMSWMGEELGMFGTAEKDDPIFFVSLKDEKKCRNIFEHIFSSVFVNQDISAIVEGLRIPRIEFPEIVKSLLRAFNIELPRPFYVIKDGYLYLSQSAEILASALNEASDGGLLVKTENWKNITKNISPESSILVYHTVRKKIPFFLKNNDVIRTILRDYGKGIISIKFSEERKILLESYSKKTQYQSQENAEFSYESNIKIDSDIYCGKNSVNIPFAYWTSGSYVYALNLASKNIYNIKLDDKAYINTDIQNGKIKNIWAVSERGTIYKTDTDLKPYSNFPILTGEKFMCPPQIIENKIVIPIANKPQLLYVDEKANTYYSEEMNSKLKMQPFIFNNIVSAIPRSFDSLIYFFDIDGKTIGGSPFELASISAVQPVLYKNPKGELWYAVLTEDGNFSLNPFEKNILEKYESELNESCKTQPVYSKNLNVFFVISENGNLYKIDTAAQITGKISLKQKNAEDYCISLLDLNNDGIDEILVSGGGNSIYAYSSNLLPIEGFPVAGRGIPNLIDVNGNGLKELITCGIDNKIHSYSFVNIKN